MTNIRFMQTTLDKLCEAKSSDELHKVYKEAKLGWKTASGEDRGGFARLQLPQNYILIINNVYYRLLYLLIENESIKNIINK